MLTIRLDSTRIARFVLRKVESTHQKSICERLRKNTARRLLTSGRVANLDVFDSIRHEWHDSSCIKSNRLTGSRFAREKNTA